MSMHASAGYILDVPNAKKVSSAAYETFVDEMLDLDPTITPGSMFGMPCLKHSGKAFGGSFDGGMVVKLGPPERAQALKLKGAELFDPSGSGRVMKEWVVIPAAHKRKWLSFAVAGMSYATSS
jgi:hypothetical protein